MVAFSPQGEIYYDPCRMSFQPIYRQKTLSVGGILLASPLILGCHLSRLNPMAKVNESMSPCESFAIFPNGVFKID